jgi:hypothetical protein
VARSDATDRFRAGLWAAPSAGCVFDAAASLRTWPPCANGAHASGHEFDSRIKRGRLIVDNRLAAGEPLILQSWTNFSGDGDPPYEYSAVRPSRRDEKGRVIVYEMWSVLCAPPEEPAAVAQEGAVTQPPPASPQTQEPLPPGIARGDHGCIAHDLPAVRGAAAMTRDLHWKETTQTYWVRPFAFRDNFGRRPGNRSATR